MTSEIEPGLVLLWIMERMDGVSMEYIANRERMNVRRVRRTLMEWGCPKPRYRMRDEYHEALALWNTGTFTWKEIVEETRSTMDHKTLQCAVTTWASKEGLEYRVGRQRGARPMRQRKEKAA